MILGRDWPSSRAAAGRWAVGLGVWIVAVAGFWVRDVAQERAARAALLEHGPRAVAVAELGGTEDGDGGLRYEHAVVGAVTVDGRDGASVGERVEIAYALDDPYRVERVSGGGSVDDRPWVVFGAVVVAAVTLGWTLFAARRTRRLMSDESPSFVMLGLVHRRAWSVVPHLSFYPVDSRPGARSTCTIRLANFRTTGWHHAVEEVEVKGLPRPGGRLVARRGDEVLYARGRALLTNVHRRPRPPGPLPPPNWPWSPPPPRWDGAGPPPPPPPPPFASTRPARPMPSAHRPPMRPLAWAVTAALGLVLATGITAVVTTVKGRASDRWMAAGEPAVATIADRSDPDEAVSVDVVLPDDPANVLEMAAPVDLPGDYEHGRRYPAVVDADRRRVRLLVEPYDRVEPVFTWAALAALPIWHVLRRLLGA